MNRHQRAREWIEEAFPAVWERDPTPTEVQIIQAMALHETGYGQAWKTDEGKASHNMGAVQAVMPTGGICPEGTFLNRDTKPADKATGRPKSVYQVCFKAYPGPVEGMADVIRILKRNENTAAAVASGDILQFSTALYDQHYYEGFGDTPAKRIAGHVAAMQARLEQVATGMGEPLLWSVPSDPASSTTAGVAVLFGLGALGLLWLAKKR